MAKKKDGDEARSNLLTAAMGVVPAPEREAWDHGWAYEDYRRSERAAISGSDGPVALIAEALSAWELAYIALSRDRSVRARWNDDEIGGLLASLVVAASERAVEVREQFLESALHRFRSGGPAFITQLVANVSWTSPPISLGDVLLGEASESIFELADSVASGRAVASAEERRLWLETRVQPRLQQLRVPPVAICCWTGGQAEKGVAEADQQIRDVLNLPLMLERDLKERKVHRRGEVNRPGVRGLRLDRGAVESAMQSGELGLELAAFPLIRNDVFSGASTVHWYSAEPLPLDDLYQQQYLRQAVERSLRDGPVGRRLRVASRWFAEAHYTTEKDDAALALGVCLDALLGGARALPGSAMGDRVAMLLTEPSERKSTRKFYMDFYGIRSSVAHGGQSSKLDGAALNTGFALAHQLAWRLLDFDVVFAPSSEAQVDEIFDDLRMGISTWPSGSAADRQTRRKDARPGPPDGRRLMNE